ncbi:MAG TPA: chromate efflux transporter [Dissulfurispiraceae bacterium]|nr:chromate efflux transporter [Dissulfurispiraceae bacterium]
MEIETASNRQLFISFLRLGLSAFGGPAIVAHIRALSVDRHKWVSEETFRDGIVLCQSIPGATAMQTAAYIGFRTKGISGALVSFVGFGLPAFLLMLVLSAIYEKTRELPRVTALFTGLQVIVIAIVANATYYFGKSTIKDVRNVLIAAGSYLSLFYGLSPFLSIVAAGLAGILLFRGTGTVPSISGPKRKDNPYRKQLALFIAFTVAGVGALYFADRELLILALLMAKIDLFAFGGGFASLPLMLHEVVNVRGWLDGKTFMDGIALGQITPGPIVITASFVGFLTNGLAGAIVATIAIFTPSFLLVIITVPFFDRLKASPIFLKVTEGILSSFVGLLLFVTVHFTLAVSWDIVKVLLVTAALIALFKKVGIHYIVPIAAVISLLIFQQ